MLSELRQQVCNIVKELLETYQRIFNVKYDFIHYIDKTYEPKKITEKLYDCDEISYKEFLEELKKVKIKLSASQQKDLLGMYEESQSVIQLMSREINDLEEKLDLLVLDIYGISEEARRRILG